MNESRGERGRQGAAPLGGHTPGPWRWEDSIGGWTNLLGGDGVIVLRVDGVAADYLPDARLIAAAPELLKTLEWLVPKLDWLSMAMGDTEALERTRSVIAKARGEQ